MERIVCNFRNRSIEMYNVNCKRWLHNALAMVFFIGFIFSMSRALPACSQEIRMEGDVPNSTFPPIKRVVYDTAMVAVYYEMKYKQDSTIDNYTTAQTVLLWGEKYRLFADYYSILKDSLIDDAAAKNKSAFAVFGEGQALTNHIKYKQRVLTNNSTGLCKVRYKVAMNQYEYEETQPAIKWTLQHQDSTLNGIACSKASCRYRGRNYEAWYAKDVALPLGPYRFGGLPGLIMQLYDTHRQFVFTLNALDTNPKVNNLVYLAVVDNLESGPRNKIMDTVDKGLRHEFNLLLAYPDGLKGSLPDFTNSSDESPYNPIELE